MKKILVLFLLLAMLTITSCEAINGILPLGKTNTARFTAHYDYGFHNNGKASLLLDGATVFFEPDEWGPSAVTGVFLCCVGQTGFGDLGKVEGRGGKSPRGMGQPCVRRPQVGCYVSRSSVSCSMLCGNVDGREVWSFIS